MQFVFEKTVIAVNVPHAAALLGRVREKLADRRGFALATLNLDHMVKLHRSPDYRQAYAAQPVRARYHLAMARYQLERGKTAAAEAELRAVPTPPEESRAEYRVLQARLASASGRYAEAMTALRQAERTGPLPKLLERELLQAMELAARELQDYKTAYECAARQLKL